MQHLRIIIRYQVNYCCCSFRDSYLYGNKNNLVKSYHTHPCLEKLNRLELLENIFLSLGFLKRFSTIVHFKKINFIHFINVLI